MGALDGLRSIDLWRKVPRDLTEGTLPGAALSALAALFAAALAGAELGRFVRHQPATSVVVDKSLNGDAVPVHFNISFPQLDCEFATLDVTNARGSHRVSIDGETTMAGAVQVTKQLLDATGRVVGAYHDKPPPVFDAGDQAFLRMASRQEERAERLLADDYGDFDYFDYEETISAGLDEHSVAVTFANFGEVTKSAPLVLVVFMAQWCPWCRMFLPVWEHTAGVVRERYGGDSHVRLAHVECVEEATLCKGQQVTGYPTVRVFHDGSDRGRQAGMMGASFGASHETYRGDRTTAALLAFIEGLVPVRVAEMANAAAAARDALPSPPPPHTSLSKSKEGFARARAMAQIERRDASATGCRVHGFVMLKKVPCNLHLGARSPAHSFRNEALNLSHVIHSLSFGHALTPDDMREISAVLKGPEGTRWVDWTRRFRDTKFVSTGANATFEHYMDVVLTTVEKPAFSIDVYEYTAHSHQYRTSSEAVEVRLTFDPSPVQVVVEDRRPPLAGLLTSLCAIVGGTFTVFSLLDGALYGTQRAIKRRMGKDF